jgi:hypothetical protein
MITKEDIERMGYERVEKVLRGLYNQPKLDRELIKACHERIDKVIGTTVMVEHGEIKGDEL